MTEAAVATVIAVALLVLLVGFALCIKGNVKAEAKIGSGSFSIETTEKNEPRN